MVQADFLFLMTDVDCLYTTNPRTHLDAKPIEVVSDISTIVADVSSSGSALGTGGMSTKIVAARLATSAGVTTVITRSSKPGNVLEIVEYVQAIRSISTTSSNPLYVGPDYTSSIPKPPLHTRFLPSSSPIRDRSFWLLHGLAPHGTIYIDEGAHRALLDKAGLLPVGVVDVEGSFSQQEAVRLVVVKRLFRPDRPRRQTPVHTPRTSTARSSGTSTPTTPLTSSFTGIASYESGENVTDNSFPATPSDMSSTLTTPVIDHPHLLMYEKSDPRPREVGRALVNYSSTEISRIKGLRSGEIAAVLEYADSEYVALRENISLVRKSADDETVEARKWALAGAGVSFGAGASLVADGKGPLGSLGAFA